MMKNIFNFSIFVLNNLSKIANKIDISVSDFFALLGAKFSFSWALAAKKNYVIRKSNCALFTPGV